MSLFKQFIKHTAIYGIATMLARGVSFLLLPLYTRALSPADYGISDLISTWIALLGIAIPLEIGQGLYRFFPDIKTEQEKINYSSTAFWFVTILYGLLLIISMPFASQLGVLILDKAENSKFIMIALCTLLVYGPFNIALLVLQCRFQAIQYGITNLIVTVVSMVVSILTVLILHLGILGVLIGNAVGYLAGLVFALIYARKDFQKVFHITALKDMLYFSTPLVPSSLGYFATLYINRFALNILLTLTDVGIFSIAYKIVSPIGLIMSSFSSALTPLVYAHHESDETPITIARIFRLVFAGCLILILFFSLFSKELLFIFTTPDYYPAANLVPILTISAVFSGLYLFTTGLVIAKKTLIIAFINILSGVLNIGLNWLLIPLLGIFGAGLATCLSVFFNFAISMYYSQKYYKVPIEWGKIILGFTITIGAIIPGILISLINWWSILIKLLVIIIVIILLLMIGLVKISETLLLIKKIKNNSLSS